MDDLISRETAIVRIDKCVALSGIGLEPVMAVRDVKALISVLPAVPAVPVVRCRDCKYYDRRCFTCENDVLLIKIDDCGCRPPFRVDDDWFCADGERRESE